MTRWGTRGLLGVSILLLASGFMIPNAARPEDLPVPPSKVANDRESRGRFVDLYCAGCHSGDESAGGLALDAIALEDVSRNPKAWEKVVRKLVARQMPPEDEVRPTRRTYDSFVSLLTSALDRAAAEKPEPGRTG